MDEVVGDCDVNKDEVESQEQRDGVSVEGDGRRLCEAHEEQQEGEHDDREEGVVNEE